MTLQLYKSVSRLLTYRLVLLLWYGTRNDGAQLTTVNVNLLPNSLLARCKCKRLFVSGAGRLLSSPFLSGKLPSACLLPACLSATRLSPVFPLASLPLLCLFTLLRVPCQRAVKSSAPRCLSRRT